MSSIPRENREIIERIVQGLSALDTSTLSALEYVVEGYEKTAAQPRAMKPYLISSEGRLVDAS